MLANIGLYFQFSKVIPVFIKLSFAVLLFTKLISIPFKKIIFIYLLFFVVLGVGCSAKALCCWEGFL